MKKKTFAKKSTTNYISNVNKLLTMIETLLKTI